MTWLNTTPVISGMNFTGMNTPTWYFHEIVWLIPNMIDTLVEWLKNPLVVVFVILAIVIWFLTWFNND